MFLFKSDEEKKADRLKEMNYDNTPEFSFKGKTFFSKILDIYDGDTLTITVKVDNEYYRMNCRLNGLDTPELKSHDEEEKNAAKLARKHLIFLLSGQKIELDDKRDVVRKLCATNNIIVSVRCLDFDKYGRLLVELYKDSICINEKMVSDGFAGNYDGGTKGNWKDYFKH